MSNVKKIQDKSFNLDVKGQGCFDDCLVEKAHWENKNSRPNCRWYPNKYTWVTDKWVF